MKSTPSLPEHLQIFVTTPQGVAIDFLIGVVAHLSVADNPAAVLVHNADHDADISLFNFDAVLQECTDGIGEVLSGGL